MQAHSPVADILPFKRPSKSQVKKRRRTEAKGNTLCRQGHHQWVIDSQQTFDVKQGKLVTVSSCSRCGKRRIEAL